MKSALIVAALLLVPAVVAAQEAAPAAAMRLPDPFAAPGQAARAPSAPGAPAAPQPINAASEGLLRAVIDGLRTGRVDYTVMADDLATQWRAKEGEYLPLVRNFGALQSVDLIGSQAGADIYAVAFARTETQWLIGINEDGKIAALLFRPVEDAAATETATPRAE